jgi:hypothetical protein
MDVPNRQIGIMRMTGDQHHDRRNATIMFMHPAHYPQLDGIKRNGLKGRRPPRQLSTLPESIHPEARDSGFSRMSARATSASTAGGGLRSMRNCLRHENAYIAFEKSS